MGFERKEDSHPNASLDCIARTPAESGRGAAYDGTCGIRWYKFAVFECPGLTREIL